jgi:hypothetical protein
MDIMQPSEGCGTGSIPVAGTIFGSRLDLRGGIFFARRLRKAGVVKADGRADGV